MDFAEIREDLAGKALAGRRYEQEGQSKFRDCLTVFRDGRLRFERYCYGEAAGLVCSLWADGLGPDGGIAWRTEDCLYSGKDEAPKRLSGVERGRLLMDGKARAWRPMEDLRTVPGAKKGLFRIFAKRGGEK